MKYGLSTRTATAILLVLITGTLAAQDYRTFSREHWIDAIRKRWETRGIRTQTGVETIEGTKCDMLTAGTAWVVAWEEDWDRAAGKSWLVHKEVRHMDGYAGVQPGVVLLLRSGGRMDYSRCARVCDDWGIRLIGVRVDQPLE